MEVGAGEVGKEPQALRRDPMVEGDQIKRPHPARQQPRQHYSYKMNRLAALAFVRHNALHLNFSRPCVQAQPRPPSTASMNAGMATGGGISPAGATVAIAAAPDRKSTRLNSSHLG